MPGRLAEKMGLADSESSLNLDSEHWRMLRLAILRQLTCEQISANVFRVSSSRPNHAPYKVDAVSLLCPCDSTVYCSHLALAVDRWHGQQPNSSDYFAARRLDFGGLHRRDDLKADDKKFIKVCTEAAREKYAHVFVPVERESVSF